LRIPAWLIVFCVLFLGALVLSPLIADLGFKPLPGDITIDWQNRPLYLPLTQSFIASVVLALLYYMARK
jgi:hypothetical protein